MYNELWGLLYAIVSFSLLLVSLRIFGKSGILVWIAFATILANIQVLKTVELFGLTATLGNVLYGSSFLATDILNERYGEKEAKKAVWLGFFSLGMMIVTMQFGLRFIPHSEDFAQGSLETIFGLVPRIALGSLIAYIISQYFDVWVYSKIKAMIPSDRLLWVRNNVSTMISQLLDTTIFCTIAFLGTYPMETWIQIFITTYVLKFLVAALDTPFLYIAKKIKLP
ncbi:queuosine precursor transporter, partial [Bacillaceae bacterium S4-13-58]